MKKIKPVLAFMLALIIMATTFAACGRVNEDAKGDGIKATESATPKSTPEATPANTTGANENTDKASVDNQQVDAKKVLGVIDGTTYTNEYFKFDVKFPEGWSVTMGDKLLELNKLGAELIQKNSDASAEVIDVALQQVIPLFLVSQYDLTYQGGSNPNINLQAQNRGVAMAAIKTPKEYLNLAVQQIKSQGIDYKAGDISEFKLSNRDFAKFDGTITVSGTEIAQTLYATYTDKHVLIFTLSYMNEDEKATLEKIMDDVEFK